MLPDVAAYSDDGSLPADSNIANLGNMFYPMCEKLGKPLGTVHHFKSRIAAAGFTNIHEKTYKVPLAECVKNLVLKEAEKFCKSQLLEGIEGYTMRALTRFGEPKPWTPEEVQVWLSIVRQEINDPKIHAYYIKKRVWAQKPLTEVARAET